MHAIANFNSRPQTSCLLPTTRNVTTLFTTCTRRPGEYAYRNRYLCRRLLSRSGAGDLRRKIVDAAALTDLTKSLCRVRSLSRQNLGVFDSGMRLCHGSFPSFDSLHNESIFIASVYLQIWTHGKLKRNEQITSNAYGTTNLKLQQTVCPAADCLPCSRLFALPLNSDRKAWCCDSEP